MANRYYRRSGEILRDDGQEIWSIYNPKLRGWERTKRANEAYGTAFQGPFHRISGEEALKSIAERQQRRDKWEERYKREHPDEWNKYHPDNPVPID